MKKRIFNVTWANKKDIDLVRTSKIEIPNASDEIGIAAKSALQIFSVNYGSLAKVEVFKIQEIDSNGNSIGEPITPEENSSIVPSKR